MSHSASNRDQLSSFQKGREFVVSGLELWQWWQWARQEAIAHAIPPDEADWLLEELTPLKRLDLRLGSFKDQAEIRLHISTADLTNLWQKRLHQRVPVQHLAGRTTWREFSLTVSPAVLIPRPETELLIDLAISAGGSPTGHWADLGTGSGAIAIGLATAFPEATIHAVDTSEVALEIAQTNVIAHQLDSRIRFYQGSWFEPLKLLKGQLSGMVSNPPYIPSQQVLELQPEVSHHEPHLALDGGEDGLDCVRHLLTMAPAYLRSGGVWMVELMVGQANSVATLLNQNGQYTNIQIHTDLAGIDRFVLAART